MKILIIADEECALYWDYFDKEQFKDIDLIVSCGDLDSRYLSFLETMTNLPLLYVHGNHDTGYERRPPEGCICIEDRIFVYKGVRFLGLGGSMRYSGGQHQYTEQQMKKRAFRLFPKILLHRGFDVLVTHAPAYSINDAADLPHQGFKTFLQLIERYKPRFFLHGHVHMSYNYKQKREDVYQSTKIINGFEKWIIEVDAPGEKHTAQALYDLPDKID